MILKKTSYNIKNCVYLWWNNLSYLALETTNYINDLKILRFKLQERGVGPKLYSLQYIWFPLQNGHIITFFFIAVLSIRENKNMIIKHNTKIAEKNILHEIWGRKMEVVGIYCDIY